MRFRRQLPEKNQAKGLHHSFTVATFLWQPSFDEAAPQLNRNALAKRGVGMTIMVPMPFKVSSGVKRKVKLNETHEWSFWRRTR